MHVSGATLLPLLVAFSVSSRHSSSLLLLLLTIVTHEEPPSLLCRTALSAATAELYDCESTPDEAKWVRALCLFQANVTTLMGCEPPSIASAAAVAE